MTAPDANPVSRHGWRAMPASRLILLLFSLMAYRFTVAIGATGFGTGLGTGEFATALAADPWQAVACIDLVACLVTICAWVFLRERRVATASVWSAAILYWGDIVLCLYVSC